MVQRMNYLQASRMWQAVTMSFSKDTLRFCSPFLAILASVAELGGFWHDVLSCWSAGGPSLSAPTACCRFLCTSEDIAFLFLSAVLVTIFYYSQKFASVTNVKTKFNYTFTSTSCRRRWPSKYSTLIKLNVLICTIKGEGTAANSLPKLPNCASSTAELTS